MSPKKFTPEAAAKGQELGRLRSVARAARLREERWKEIDFLLRSGSTPEEAARRIGVSLAALSRQAYRHQMKEYTVLFSRAYDRERTSRPIERRRV